MGAGASAAGVVSAVSAATSEELSAHVQELPEEARQRLKDVLASVEKKTGRLEPNMEDHITSVMQAFPFQGYIPETENRAISISQLRRLREYFEKHSDKWYDTAPAAYSKTSGKPCTLDILNLYMVNTWLIMPATKKDDCAFVELLSGERQKPDWFCSHWWGEVVKDFLACVEEHAWRRKALATVCYWICAYANRQHSLAGEVTADPSQTSFYKALNLAIGVLLILDRREEEKGSGPATPFTRVWCAFEEFVALTTQRKEPILLDIATCEGGDATLLSDGVAENDYEENDAFDVDIERAMLTKRQREETFPVGVLKAGLTLSLEKAQASCEDDRVHILNSIAGQPLEQRPPLEKHDKYDEVNQLLSSRFALAIWNNRGQLRNHENKTIEQVGVPEVLARATSLKTVDMNFFHSLFDDRDLEVFCSAVKPLSDLQFLSLNVSYNSQIKAATPLCQILSNFKSLECLRLNFRKTSIEDVGGLASRLEAMQGSSLKELKLDVSECDISDCTTLLSSVGGLDKLEHLVLKFFRCEALKKSNFEILADSLIKLPKLRHLEVMFPDQCVVGAGLGKALDKLTKLEFFQTYGLPADTLPLALPGSLKFFEINSPDAGISDVEWLAEALPKLASLRSLRISLNNNNDLKSVESLVETILSKDGDYEDFLMDLKGCNELPDHLQSRIVSTEILKDAMSSAKPPTPPPMRFSLF